MIAFACSRCNKSFQVKDEFAGRSTCCPACKLQLVVPASVALAAGPISPKIKIAAAVAALFCFVFAIVFAIGALLAFFACPSRPSKDETTKDPANVQSLAKKEPEISLLFPGAEATAEEVLAAMTKWKKTQKVSERQWDELIDNYEAKSKGVSWLKWWEEAKDKTPAELNKLYPPLQPRERYRAEWPLLPSTRRLGLSSFTGERSMLEVSVIIRTEPGVPIKELHGHLAFLSGNEVIYEERLAEKPKVSFIDRHHVFLRILYDDNDHKYRTLRFARDNELTPVFTVRKVVLADGKEKVFE